MKVQSKSAMLKKQMMSAVSMMLAAAVALGSSTYAWFVNRSRAEVKDVLFQASAGKNLEIAGAVVEEDNASALGLSVKTQVPQGKANSLTYYTSVTPEILGANSFTYPKYDGSAATYMTPVSIDGNDIKITPAQSTFFKAEGWDSAATSGGSAVGAYNTYSKVTSNDGKEYICAQMYFKASSDMDVYLNELEWKNFASGNKNAVDTSAVDVPYITYYRPTGSLSAEELQIYQNEAKELASAMRMAFVTGKVEDGGDPTTNSSRAVMAFTNDNITSGGYYNTEVPGGTTIITSDTPIKSVGSDNKATAVGTAVTDTVEDYSIENGSSGTEGEKTVSISGKQALFSLTANVPKRVTVYIWLEGTDKDCVSALSSFRAGVYLPFVGVVLDDDNNYKTYTIDDDIELLDDIELINEDNSASKTNSAVTSDSGNTAVTPNNDAAAPEVFDASEILDEEHKDADDTNQEEDGADEGETGSGESEDTGE